MINSALTLCSKTGPETTLRDAAEYQPVFQRWCGLNPLHCSTSANKCEASSGASFLFTWRQWRTNERPAEKTPSHSAALRNGTAALGSGVSLKIPAYQRFWTPSRYMDEQHCGGQNDLSDCTFHLSVGSGGGREVK